MSWSLANLGDLCEINIGRTPSRSRTDYWGRGYPWLSIADMNQGRAIVKTKECITPLAVKECNCREVQAETVLLSFKLSIGKVGIAQQPLFTNEAIAALPIRDHNRLDSKFLAWALQSIDLTQGLDRAAKGLTLNKAKLLNLRLPVPPVSEQCRLAAILDQADTLRAKRRETLAQLDSLKQSIFMEMFGDPATNPKRWEVNPLHSFTLTVTNGMTRRRSERDEGTTIVLRLRDIRAGWIDFSDVNRITLEPNESKKYSVSPGDLLFIRVNGNPDYVGRCAIFEGHPEPVFFNDHIMRVKVDYSRILSVFLAFLLNGKYGKSEISKHRKTSAGQHTINQDGLGKIQLPTPPVAMQTEFVRRLESIERQKATHSSSLAELDALFASLQHRAFRGEL